MFSSFALAVAANAKLGLITAEITVDQGMTYAQKNVGSKEPTFANGIRLLTSERLFCRLRSCR